MTWFGDPPSPAYVRSPTVTARMSLSVFVTKGVQLCTGDSGTLARVNEIASGNLELASVAAIRK